MKISQRRQKKPITEVLLQNFGFSKFVGLLTYVIYMAFITFLGEE